MNEALETLAGYVGVYSYITLAVLAVILFFMLKGINRSTPEPEKLWSRTPALSSVLFFGASCLLLSLPRILLGVVMMLESMPYKFGA